MAHEVFISYRKSISQREADILKRQIDDCFGAETAFLDARNLESGGSWPSDLKEKLLACKVVIVVIGKGWLKCSFSKTDHSKNIFIHQRRIDHPEDWVCIEIEEGHKAKKAIPFFMGGATTNEVEARHIATEKTILRDFFSSVQGNIIPKSQNDFEVEPIFRVIEKKGLTRRSKTRIQFKSNNYLVFDKKEIMTEYDCYCCNRNSHYDIILDFFHKNYENKPHLYFFLPSIDEDKPESFIARFLSDPDAINGDYIFANRSSDESSNKITHEDLKPSICKKIIQRRIKQQISLAITPNQTLWETFLFRINLRDWTEKHLKVLVEYLASSQFKADFGSHKLLIFFWLNTIGLERPPKKRFLSFFSKKQNNQLPFIRTSLAAFDNMLCFEEMPLVQEHDVRDWFSTYCGDTKSYKNVIRQLFNALRTKLI